MLLNLKSVTTRAVSATIGYRLRIETVVSLLLIIAPITRVAAQTPPTAGPATAATATYPNRFSRIAIQKFDTWDTDHDGILSEKEIDSLLLNPKIVGEEAATLATLKISAHPKVGTPPVYTKDYFERYVAYVHSHHSLPTPAVAEEPGEDGSSVVKAGAEPLTAGATADPAVAAPTFPAFHSAWTSCFNRIHQGTHNLFSNDAPSMSKIHQGRIGDCYFLSVLGALINRDSASVRGMIKPLPDGSCDVTFPQGQKVHVPALTDGEIAVSSSASETGTWVAVFEHAFGDVREQAKGLAESDTVATDLIKTGGSTRKTIEFLTGHAAGKISFRASGATSMPTEDAIVGKLPTVRANVIAALKDKRLVAASTDKCLQHPPAINTNHAYAVTAYDPAADTITLWNPHGNTFTPKGAPGLENGYNTVNGFFTLPLPEFARIFSGIVWETMTPAVPSSTTTPLVVPVAPLKTRLEPSPILTPSPHAA